MAARAAFRDEMQGAVRSEWPAAAKGVAGSAHHVRGGDPVAEHLAAANAAAIVRLRGRIPVNGAPAPRCGVPFASTATQQFARKASAHAGFDKNSPSSSL